MSEPRPDIALELAFSGGLALGGAGLLLGLALGHEPLLRAGILALIATPAAATAILAVGLLRRREWLFAGLGLWVLFVLFSSVVVATRI